MKQIIIKNAAKCRNCGDVIESTHVHDFVKCSCFKNEERNRGIAVDGGTEYLRRVGDPLSFEDKSIVLEKISIRMCGGTMLSVNPRCFQILRRKRLVVPDSANFAIWKPDYGKRVVFEVEDEIFKIWKINDSLEIIDKIRDDRGGDVDIKEILKDLYEIRMNLNSVLTKCG